MTCLSFHSVSECYVYVTCVMLGISMLMPLNALTSAPSYMLSYYKYVTGDPDAQPNSKLFWDNILTFYNVASVGTQIICGPTVLTSCMRKLSLTVRFTGALCLMMVEVLVIVLMPVGKGVSQNSAMAAFFVSTIAAGAGKSYLESTSYATVSTMPPKFMSAIMFGCGFSGVIASVLQCIIKAAMPDTYEMNKRQSYIYFSLALGFMAVTLLMALSLRWNNYARAHVGEFRQLALAAKARLHAAETTSTEGHREPVDEAEGDVVMDEEVGASPEPVEKKLEEEDNEVRVVNLEGGASDDDMEAEGVEEQKNMTTSEQLQHTRIRPVFMLIYPTMISCFCVFFVSLFIFPSLVVPINRASKWFTTIAILCYNCGDAAGRLSSTIRKIWPNRYVMLICALCRFVFIVLIFLCIYKYIPGDVAPYVFMAVIGLTNGFFGATCMAIGPNTPGLKTDGQHAMAGQLMGISLLAGASVSALLALLVVIFLP